MELQRGVVGDLASMPALSEAAQEVGLLASVARIVPAARSAGVPIVHARVHWASDRRGTPLNTPLVAALARDQAQMLTGTPAVDPIEQLGDTTGDLVSWRRHGLTPFVGTDLDPLLRSLGTTTVVAIGVSLNVGIAGLCLNAADLGYRVVVPTDAVVGVPERYGHDVLANTVSMVATLSTVEALIDSWS